MSPILAPTESERRAAAMANLEALFRAMTGLPGSTLEEGGPVSRHLAFPTNPMFKGAWATRAADDAAIEVTIDAFAGRGAPVFFWWAGPDTPPDFGPRLEARGLLSMEGQQQALAHGIVQTAAGAPCMVMDLASADDSLVGRAIYWIERIAVQPLENTP